MKTRYAFVVLVVLMLAMSGVNVMYSAHLAGQVRDQAAQQVRQTQQAICSLLDAALAVRVAKPADPAQDPTQETTWEWQQRYAAVSKAFNCEGKTS